MARVLLAAPFDAAFFGGRGEVAAAGGNLFQLVAALDALAPGFASEAELTAAFAVDGEVRADWSAPVAADSEVLVFPRIAGGAQPAIGT